MGAIERAGALLAALFLWAALALAAPTFPELTGRIVDAADVIPPATRAALEPKLEALETKSGIQLVVATVKSLEGQAIEPYANELFRHWKLGEATKNNGVLLLIAPNERKVRVEVGYGLEGTLTDALSKIVIANAIAPRFKAGDFGGGVERGVDDIIIILTTDAAEWQKRPQVREEPSGFDQLLPLLIFGLVIFIIVRSMAGPRRMGPGGRSLGGGPIIFLPPGGGGWGSGTGGFGGGGGGFSGGGGSSGGGGASGDW
jgi:uncharacterized protein